MSVVEKDATYKIQWQITGKDVKSDEITLEGNSQILCLGVKSHSFHQVLYLVAKSGYPFTTEIVEVFFNTCSASALDQRKQMTRVAGDEGQNHQVFSYEIMTEWKTPMMLTLWITLRQSIDEYSFQFGDTLLTDQLWSAAKSRKLTDIEIRVLKPGGLSTSSADRVTFYAHRSVLAARSPVFAGLIEKSLVSSAIDIDQVEPEVFKNLLYFIYTGRLSTHCGLADLQILADRYQVSTLQKMLRRPAVEMNASVLTSLIMSLQHSSSKSFYPSMTNNRLLKQETLSCSSGDNTNNGQSPLLLFGAPEIHSTGIIASPAVIQQRTTTNLFGFKNLSKINSSAADHRLDRLGEANGRVIEALGTSSAHPKSEQPFGLLPPGSAPAARSSSQGNIFNFSGVDPPKFTFGAASGSTLSTTKGDNQSTSSATSPAPWTANNTSRTFTFIKPISTETDAMPFAASTIGQDKENK